MDVIAELENENQNAVRQFVNFYFPLVKKRMSKRVRGLRIGDEEDVAIETLHTFLKLAKQGRFRSIVEHHQVTATVLLIAKRKLSDMYKYETAKKRGGDNVVLRLQDVNGINMTVPAATNSEREIPSPFDCESTKLLIDSLASEELRRVVRHRISGLSNREISHRMGLSLRTVQYRLAEVRKLTKTWLETNDTEHRTDDCQ